LVTTFVAAVFHGNRLRLAHRRGFIENGVEGAVFLFVSCNEMQVLALLTAYARDAQRRKQNRISHSFPGDKRLIRDGRAAEQVIILPITVSML